MKEDVLIFIIGVPLGVIIGGLILWLQNRKKQKDAPPPEGVNAGEPLYYQAVAGSEPKKTRYLKVDLTQDEWREYRHAISVRRRRFRFAFILLGLALMAAGAFGNAEGLGVWMLMGFGFGFILVALVRMKPGLTKEGIITDRAKLDSYVTASLKKAYDEELHNPTVSAVKELPEAEAPDRPVEAAPKSAFFPEQKPLDTKTLLIGALVILAFDALWFLLWRNNIAGWFAGFLGIVACILAAGFWIGWGTCRGAGSRITALVFCLCFAVAGGLKLYGDYRLIPEALKTLSGETETVPDESFGKAPGLVVIRKDEQSRLRCLQLPLGDPLSFRYYAYAEDRQSDSAHYGFGNEAAVRGVAYNCDIRVEDRLTHRMIGYDTIYKSLPEKISAQSGTYTKSATDGEIMAKVNSCIRNHEETKNTGE